MIPGIPDSAVAALGAQHMQRPSGIAALLADPALQQALLGTGTALLQQSDRPGTFGGALGRALPAGMQAFQQGRADQAQEERERRFREMLRGLPPEQAAVFDMMGVDGGGLSALAQTFATPEPVRGVAVADGTQLRNPVTGALLAENEAGPERRTPDIENYLFAQEQGYKGTFPEYQASQGRGPLVEVNTGDRAASAFGQTFGTNTANSLEASSVAAETSVGLVDSVDRVMGLLDSAVAENVFGPLSDMKTLRERFSENPEAREIAAMADVLFGDVILERIQALSGPKSEGELKFIAKTTASDRNLTVEEVRAGMGMLRKVAERDLTEFLDEFGAISTNAGAFEMDPAQLDVMQGAVSRARGALNPQTPEEVAREFNVPLVRGRGPGG